MIIKLINEDTLIVREFKLKCCIGRNGISKNKIEGDFKTPRGTFKFGTLYWRPDRVKKPFTKLYCKKIKKKMGWCNDSKSKIILRNAKALTNNRECQETPRSAKGKRMLRNAKIC